MSVNRGGDGSVSCLYWATCQGAIKIPLCRGQWKEGSHWPSDKNLGGCKVCECRYQRQGRLGRKSKSHQTCLWEMFVLHTCILMQQLQWSQQSGCRFVLLKKLVFSRRRQYFYWQNAEWNTHRQRGKNEKYILNEDQGLCHTNTKCPGHSKIFRKSGPQFRSHIQHAYFSMSGRSLKSSSTSESNITHTPIEAFSLNAACSDVSKTLKWRGTLI